MLQSDECPQLFALPGVQIPLLDTLTWADCTASGYGIRFPSFPPANPNAANPNTTGMLMRITVP